MARAPSCKVYNAVPPPQPLITGIESFGNEQVNADLAAGVTSTMGTIPAPPVPPVMAAGVSSVFSQAALLHSRGMLNSAQPQSNMVGYSQPILSGGTSYCGYEGIYPQATPLQQVALALRQSTSPVTAVVAPTTSIAYTSPVTNASQALEKEKRPHQKRKFQELPANSIGTARFVQVSGYSYLLILV